MTPKCISLAWTLQRIPDPASTSSNRHLKTEFLSFSPQKSCPPTKKKKVCFCPNPPKGGKWPCLEKVSLRVWLRISRWDHPGWSGWALKPKEKISPGDDIWLSPLPFCWALLISRILWRNWEREERNKKTGGKEEKKHTNTHVPRHTLHSFPFL